MTPNNTDNKKFIGIIETDFKTRFRKHQKALNHWQYENDTERSKYVWSLRGRNIKWSVVRKANSYNPITKS